MSNSEQHSSRSVEHLTPVDIVRRAQAVLGEIDLDPASTERANRVIKAKKIYVLETNGLRRKWHGHVFLNPPGGIIDTQHLVRIQRRVAARPKLDQPEVLPCTETGSCGLPPGHVHMKWDLASSAAYWWAKLMQEITAGRVKEAIFIGFSLELLATAQTFDCQHPMDFSLCIPQNRLRFDTVVDDEREPGNSPTHANVIVYTGGKARTFWQNFKDLGHVQVMHLQDHFVPEERRL